MPYVLIHKHDRRIYGSMLINVYKIPYYGAKYWDSLEEGKAEAQTFLEARNETAPGDWELLEVEEDRLKLFNVKFANNPNRLVRLEEDGRVVGYTMP